LTTSTLTGSDLPRWIAPAFLVSGFAALIYQTVWQRVLFSSFGINIEAVTVVVTAFLLGLGIGSIVGGALSKDTDRPLLLIFAALELSIAVYGFVSVPLFRWIADWTAGMPSLATGIITFVLVLIPTLFMGATLPLLVAFSVRISHNVGRSVGWLYFVNTAGSACAAITAATFMMGSLGESGSVRLAALLNACVGIFVLTRYRASRRS
jgi:predicted membrane-bound spermidine synthase